ncbi:hypothetical protein BDN70DRAFT_962425 [Pholiota conissans]|uniref:Uncharacterized protein n=1 Tax=Pholiota conissans TaxID=109636 RepID=A0A9P6CPM0_9AGAR|nr:hypothetical protein BDN70DRAFT_962425 [Pholiota conissans]
MDSYVEIYNQLPTLGEAEAKFVDREATFSKLVPLLEKYDYNFGVCLVHAHCTLNPGEKMIATGHVSEPVDANTLAHHPVRWLDDGRPFEFTVEPTVSPPDDLITAFKALVGHIGVLGLYYSAGVRPSDDHLELEWTEGRKNITKIISKDANNPANIETAWLPGTKNPVTMSCVIYCNIAKPRPNGPLHAGTKGHQAAA